MPKSTPKKRSRVIPIWKTKKVLAIELFIVVNIVALAVTWVHGQHSPSTNLAAEQSNWTASVPTPAHPTIIPTGSDPDTSSTSSAPTVNAPDQSVPQAPTALSGSASSSNIVSLSWNYSYDPGGKIIGYYVIRNGVNLGLISGRKYIDARVLPNVNYTYDIKAVGRNGNVSAASSISIETPPTFRVTLDNGVVSPAAPESVNVNTSAVFTFPVSANTAGMLTYQIITTTGYILSTGSLSFNGPGTQNISSTISFDGYWNSIPSETIKAQLQILEPETLNSNLVTIDFNNPWD